MLTIRNYSKNIDHIKTKYHYHPLLAYEPFQELNDIPNYAAAHFLK